MSDVMVRQLAETVGAPVDRLLKQMAEAGLPQTSEDDLVTEEEKQILLAYLQRSHGASDAAPKRITLNALISSALPPTPDVSGGAGIRGLLTRSGHYGDGFFVIRCAECRFFAHPQDAPIGVSAHHLGS